MPDQFYTSRETNNYDNLVVDAAKLYAQFPVGEHKKNTSSLKEWTKNPFYFVYRAWFLPWVIRKYLWHILHRSTIDQTWFERFEPYWTQVLKGRPLWGVQDFYFLRGLYRVKFQRNQIPDTPDATLHLKAWQQPEVLYQLLHLVYKESVVNELVILGLIRRYCKKRLPAVLEYGCGTAPIVTSIFEFLPSAPRMKIYITDIATLAFHYAAYKFKNCANVHPIILKPEDEFRFSNTKKFDAIFSITVFEHLNKPLETIKMFHDHLNKNGLLLFDYIKSEGGGLDTRHAVRERRAVLDFIHQNFEVIVGRLDGEHSMGLTVVRKKQTASTAFAHHSAT